MQELVHADIFFFVTTIAVVVLTIGFAILLYYVIQIVRDVRVLVAKFRRAGEEVEADFEALRASVREEGRKSKMVVDIALEWLVRKLRPPVRRRVKKTEEPSSPEV